MADIDINQLLMQMRSVAAAAQSHGKPPVSEAPAQGMDFASLLKQSVEQVNSTQMRAGEMTAAFVKGDPNVDLTEVMVATQKASLSFQAMTQVRNKLVQAYQEVMSMSM